MPLRVTFVSRFADVVEPAVEFLSRPGDLFARPRIVVPTAGARAWLAAELSRRLGAVDGCGVFANVDLVYPGALATYAQPSRGGAADPWGIDRLTFTVLDVLAADPGLAPHDDARRDPLLAARRIAARFDRYHVRRPALVRSWERGGGVLSPTADDPVHDGERAVTALDREDRWQFALWRAVRERIGEPSPPERIAAGGPPAPVPLLVAGLQAVSSFEMLCLERLGGAGEVEVLLVHPSPPLRRRQAVPIVAGGGPLPRRPGVELTAEVDPLVTTWLQGSREMQVVLAAHGVAAAERPDQPDSAAATLLGRMQRTIGGGVVADPAPHDPAGDHSFTIHRCHSLSRQAEVVHEALLHAFRDLPGLTPDEVVIASPCIAEAAPHLRAVFDREPGPGGRERLPLVVADRGIREASPAIDLLVRVLTAVDSRCGVDELMAIVSHPLVREHVGLDGDAIDACWHLVERAQIRWGLDAAHRTRCGLAAGIPEVHSWMHGLERMLLGATLPDAPARPELGGAVPLDEVDVADLERMTALARVVDGLRGLATATAVRRPASAWCDLVDAALVGLCGPECQPLVEAVAEVQRLRIAAATSEVPVPFADVKTLLVEQCEDRAGRQPLRTGAITATSLVPFRGIPFRVVVVMGYDESALPAGEAEGDDLVARQQLAGDGDPRLDQRRALLDALLAARDRLLVVCTGLSIRTNKPVPLPTPLAEMVDFAVRHGVQRDARDGRSGVEVVHPRHAIGGRNFRPGLVEPGIVWSHDAAALAASIALGRPLPPRPAAAWAPAARPVWELPVLERMVRDPLAWYLQETLAIDARRHEEASIPATFPLDLSSRDSRRLTTELLEATLADRDAEAAWVRAVVESGRLPFGGFGTDALTEIRELVAGIRDVAAAAGVPLREGSTVDLRVETAAGRVVGRLGHVYEETGDLVVVMPRTVSKDDTARTLYVAGLRLAAARADGQPVERARVVSRRDEWFPGKLVKGAPMSPAQVRTVVCAAELDPREWLTRVCELAAIAAAGPCAEFGTAAFVPADDRHAAFDAFVRSQSRGGGPDRFATSSEALVYGLSVTFDVAYPPGSAAAAFLDRCADVFRLEYQRKGGEYRLG